MSNNPFKSQRIEFHILQAFPVTCLNRDDVGAPKTAMIGGSTRARVSSQCWKRQVRKEMSDLGVKVGIRTKRIKEVLEAAMLKIDGPDEKTAACATKIADALCKDTLLFFTESEAAGFAEYAASLDYNLEEMKPDNLVKDIAKISKKTINPAIDGIDIALFGRMVAKAPSMNIEAAASFSHAISTHAINNELDFFTAMDDINDEQGSSHMGLNEFNSSTYYRYISLDLGQLWQTTDGHNMSVAVDAFTKALYLAIPTARQTTQAGLCPWEFAKVFVRKGQGLQASFETAVRPSNGGHLSSSIKTLTSYLQKKERSEEHTSELQSRQYPVCRLLL